MEEATERLVELEELPPVVAGPGPPRGPIDLHCYFYEPGPALAAHERLLSADERERRGRYRFERDRDLYLATRVLARTVLSRYAPIDPASWRFEADAHGKPRVAGPEGAPPLSFNLSNVHGLVVCAVSAHAQLGVDTEDTTRPLAEQVIAEHTFSPLELRALRALPPARQRERFFSLWTLKESYLKARGLGLSLPLDAFSMHLDDPRAIRVSFDRRIEDDPARWRFVLLRASPRHLVALCADAGEEPLTVRAAAFRL